MPGRAVIKHVVQLVKIPIDAIDDEQMAIAAAAQIDVARLSALYPVCLRDRFVGNRIERITEAGGVIDAVAFGRVVELHGPLRDRRCRQRRTEIRRCRRSLSSHRRRNRGEGFASCR